jgi:hypothetical protein
VQANLAEIQHLKKSAKVAEEKYDKQARRLDRKARRLERVTATAERLQSELVAAKLAEAVQELRAQRLRAAFDDFTAPFTRYRNAGSNYQSAVHGAAMYARHEKLAAEFKKAEEEDGESSSSFLGDDDDDDDDDDDGSDDGSGSDSDSDEGEPRG